MWGSCSHSIHARKQGECRGWKGSTYTSICYQNGNFNISQTIISALNTLARVCTDSKVMTLRGLAFDTLALVFVATAEPLRDILTTTRGTALVDSCPPSLCCSVALVVLGKEKGFEHVDVHIFHSSNRADIVVRR